MKCFTSDGFRTSAALLGKQLSVTVGTIWLIVLGRELLLGQLFATLGAGETFPMPGLVLVGHTPFVNHLSKQKLKHNNFLTHKSYFELRITLKLLKT